MPYIESLEEFTLRQDCDRFWTGQRWLYSNGAVVDENNNFIEPPEDEMECIRYRVRFYEEKASLLTDAYRRLRKNVTEQTDFHKRGVGPAPAKEAIGQMKLLSKRIEFCNRRAETLREQLPQTPMSKTDEYKKQCANNASDFQMILNNLPNY